LIDVLVILAGALLALSVGVAIEYYRQLHKVRKEYKKAKEAVEDIVLSFNRQFKQESQKVELVAYKVEAISSKSESAASSADALLKRVDTFESRVADSLEETNRLSPKLDELDKKVVNAIASEEALTARVTEVEQKVERFSFGPEARAETVIPIKREKAFAPLTETEVSVLEMLTQEGPRTAPEIKERIELSREHTARLMKKLYEDGYLERETGKIPFKYSVKKEMERLLKKAES
jgi:hypothetical protein